MTLAGSIINGMLASRAVVVKGQRYELFTLRCDGGYSAYCQELGFTYRGDTISECVEAFLEAVNESALPILPCETAQTQTHKSHGQGTHFIPESQQ